SRASGALGAAPARPPLGGRARVGACPETAVHGGGGTVSASIRRRWTRVRERPTRAAAHRRSDGAQRPRGAVTDRRCRARAAAGGGRARRRTRRRRIEAETAPPPPRTAVSVTLLVAALRRRGERDDAPPHEEVGLAPAARVEPALVEPERVLLTAEELLRADL